MPLKLQSTCQPIFIKKTDLEFCCSCLVAKLCRTLCDPMNYSPPSSAVHRIPQARILE